MPTERSSSSEKEPSPGNNGLVEKGIKAKLAAKFKRRPDEMGKKKQLHDYTAWVNNYLKRKPGVELVTDLRTNLQDGVTFINLIEIITKVELEGVDRAPATSAARKANIERAVGYLHSSGVNISSDAVRDIMDGNSKGIMRVILAVAERYQPRSVKPRSTSDPKPYGVAQYQSRDHVTSDRVQYRDHVTSSQYQYNSQYHHEQEWNQAAAAGQQIRSHSPDRLYHHGNQQPMQSHYGGNSISKSLAGNSFSVPNMAAIQRQSLPPPHPPPPHYAVGYGPPQHGLSPLSQPTERSYQDPPQQEGGGGGGGGGRDGRAFSLSQADLENELYSTPVDQLPPSAKPHIVAPRKKLGVQLRLRSGSMQHRSIPEEPVPPGEGGVATVATAPDEITQEMSAMVTGLNEFKSELLQLHALLLRNTEASQEKKTASAELPQGVGGASSEATPTPGVHASLQASSSAIAEQERDGYEQQIADLQDQLTQLRDESTGMQAECSTLRNMVEERDAFITTMKSEIYRKEYKNDTQRVDLRTQILQKDSLLKKMENELTTYRSSLEDRQAEFEEMKLGMIQQSSREEENKSEIDRLQLELSRLSMTEEGLLSKLSGRDKKIAQMEDKLTELTEGGGGGGRGRHRDSAVDEVDSIREGFAHLREGLAATDPRQQAVDQLEKHVSQLVTQLYEGDSPAGRKGAGSPVGKRSRRRRGEGDEHHREKEREKRKRHHKEKHTHSATAEPKGAEPPQAIPTASSAGGETTKVYYYMLSDKTETPYTTSLPRKSGGVTLKDFKSVFDRHGTYSFFVKTEDPDCGVVKEEIIHDDHCLPSWNGKLMVWVGEKSSHHK